MFRLRELRVETHHEQQWRPIIAEKLSESKQVAQKKYEQRDEHSPHATQREGGGARTVNIKEFDMSAMDECA
jgi:hypothetical protein